MTAYPNSMDPTRDRYNNSSDKIKISVVVPVYNAEAYIENCINALLSQHYPINHYEIIMVDNNSKDSSPEIIRRYPDIRYLKEGRQGSYAARNKGIVNAKGKIIAFTDPDCIPAGDWLQNIEDAFLQPEISVILGKNHFYSDSHILSMLSEYDAAKAAYVFSNSNKLIYYGYTNNMAIRKTMFSRIGLFLEIFRGADAIFVRQVVDNYSCNTVGYFHNMTVRHIEISNPLVYFQKQYIYGKSLKAYRKIRASKSLSTAERFKIFKTACHLNQYSLIKAGLFLGILLMGAFCYELGCKGGTLNNEAR